MVRLKRSNVKIDVIIPVIRKDLDVLPFTIQAIKKQVKHPIGKVFIVAPKDKAIKMVCHQQSCIYVDERSILPIKKSDIDYKISQEKKVIDRSGWLLQQFIKLSGDRLSKESHYLVVDADTILLKPHVFLKDGKHIFYYRNNTFKEYYATYERLLGKRATCTKSFVTHYMLISQAKLKELKDEMERIHKTSWFEAIIRSIDKQKRITFSEFETFGNFFYDRSPEEILFKKNKNLSLSRRKLKELDKQSKKTLAKSYRSISYHIYTK